MIFSSPFKATQKKVLKKRVTRRAFTLLELFFAMMIFTSGVLLLIEQRNNAIQASYYAARLLKAQNIVDKVFARYRLYPFSTEALEDLDVDYAPFTVDVTVAKESINILPKDQQIEDYEAYYDEHEKEKERIILKVTVDVGFSVSFNNTAGVDNDYHYKVSTLIRHIELRDEDEIN